jgi:hypothetical protein
LLVVALGVSLAGVASAQDAPADDAEAKPEASEPADPAAADEEEDAYEEAEENGDENGDADAAGAQPSPAAAKPAAQTPAKKPAAKATLSVGNPDEDADSADEPESKRLPPRVPWRGTAFSWGHSVTTSALGIGDDYISDSHQSYTQNFSLGLNYFVVDQEKFSVAVATNPSMSVELTNSNSTTTEREPWFNDLPVSGVFRARLYSHDELPIATGLVANGTVLLPTSPASHDTGTVLTTSPRLVLWQAIPLLPKDVSPVLNSVAIGVSGRWDHRFGLATTPVNSDLARPRMNAAGDTFKSDDIGFNPIAGDTLREGAFVFFSQGFNDGMQINVVGAFSLFQRFLPDFDDSTIALDTGDAPVGRDPDRRTVQYHQAFFAGVDYFPLPEAGVSLGYSSSSNQLGPDGRHRNVFYNPNSQFSASLVVSLDAIYEAATGPRRSNPFVLVADNKQKKTKKKNNDKRQSPGLGVVF